MLKMYDEMEYIPYGRFLEFLASLLMVGTVFSILYFA